MHLCSLREAVDLIIIAPPNGAALAVPARDMFAIKCASLLLTWAAQFVAARQFTISLATDAL